jgi:hypothetical protein
MASVNFGLNEMARRMEKALNQRTTFWVERLPVQRRRFDVHQIGVLVSDKWNA